MLSQCLNFSAPMALSAVSISSCTAHFFQGLCMIGDGICVLVVMHFGSGLFQVVSDMSPVVWLNSFRGTALQQDLLFNAQDSILGGNYWCATIHNFCWSIGVNFWWYCECEKQFISDSHVDYAIDTELLQMISLPKAWSLILPRTQPINKKQLLRFSGSSIYPA